MWFYCFWTVEDVNTSFTINLTKNLLVKALICITCPQDLNHGLLNEQTLILHQSI